MSKQHGIYLSDSTFVFFTISNSGIELLLEEYTSNPDFEEKCKVFLSQYK